MNRHNFVKWCETNLGKAPGVWYYPYLEKMGFYLNEFELIDKKYKENFFEYTTYEEYKVVYQEITQDNDDVVKAVLEGKSKRYLKDTTILNDQFLKAIALYQFDRKERNRADQYGGIPKLGVVLRAYLKYLYYTENTNVVYPPSVEIDLQNSKDINYWYLAPGYNAAYWSKFKQNGYIGIGWDDLGDLSKYNSQAEINDVMVLNSDENIQSFNNNAKTCFDFSHNIRIGDIILAKTSTNVIIGKGVVTSPYMYDETDENIVHKLSVDWLDVDSIEVDFIIPQKTLTRLNNKEKIKQIEASFRSDEELITPYSKADFLSDVYLEEDKLNTIINTLERKKNIVLSGPPGVGKTYMARKIANLMQKEVNNDCIKFIQFHQSYAYEDLVEGFRPRSDADGFILQDGPFKSFCKEAIDNKESDYFLIIDEINRGNISKIFGELLMLIENDKREDAYCNLLYSNEIFTVPDNLYIIGMMNTADRSLAHLDYALRRRFAFIDITPSFDNEVFKTTIKSEILENVVEVIKSINNQIKDDLGSGFMIGHSYFNGNNINEIDVLKDIIDYEIIPLLNEYYFDQEDVVENYKNLLLGIFNEA